MSLNILHVRRGDGYLRLMALRTRRDVYGLQEWDDVLLWYARAVHSMRHKHEADPTSWRYQANVHGVLRKNPRPGAWDQCEHQTWFFLPWHRAYLYCWESIVQATIVELHGPPDWSLPYWNYSDDRNSNARVLPAAFRDVQWPDGKHNPLLVRRKPTINGGQPIPAKHLALTALTEPFFEGTTAPGGTTGFGGPITAFPNHQGNYNGVLENQPHNVVHVDIGGLMLYPETAAQDPIFWLHHANIDRLWSSWLAAPQNQHQNPTNGAWVNQRYPLHDATGAAVTFTAAQVLDSTAAPLSYQYEKLEPGAAPRVDLAVTTPPSQQQPELLGATDAPLILDAGRALTTLSLEAPTGPAAEVADVIARQPAGPTPAGARVHLNLENVTGTGGPTNYDVYVNLPQGADPEEHQELYAGVLAPFGIARASSQRDPHTGGSGISVAFDITAVVAALRAAGRWDPDNVEVSFVPTPGDDETSPITVGRVSVYLTK
jgi:tyrosinase